MTATDYIAPVLSLAFILIGGFSFGWFRILKQTNTLLKEQNIELKNQNEHLRAEDIENKKDIATLKGQIDTLTKIPLQAIDSSLKALSDATIASAASNDKIFKILEKSATTLAKDTEAAAKAARTVKTTLTKDTAEAASAAEEVKSELEKNK